MSERAAGKVVREIFEELGGLVQRKIDEINESAAGDQKFTYSREEDGEPPTLRVERGSQYIRLVCNTDSDLNHILIEIETKAHLRIQPYWDEANGRWRFSVYYGYSNKSNDLISVDKLWAVVRGILDPYLG